MVELDEGDSLVRALVEVLEEGAKTAETLASLLKVEVKLTINCLSEHPSLFGFNYQLGVWLLVIHNN